jgi:hypothetical protein
MTLHMKNPTAGGAAGLYKTSLPGRNDGPSNAPEIAPAQAEILRNPRAVREAKLELLRDAVHEACGFIRLHAEACQLLAEAGDDAGMLYSLGRLIAFAKEAARTGIDLRAIREAAAASAKGGGQ